MIEIFKTNVHEPAQAEMLMELLLSHFPGSCISFDLEDCDRILRVKHNIITTQQVSQVLNRQGYHCEPLND